MKVSFLVTYYNQEEYVEKSLNSILAIKKPCEWEIIVGDDGSSDETVNRVKDFMNRYPKNISLYIMPRNKGKKYDSVKRASANRLNILEHATGNLFCMLDGDDFYFDDDFILDSIKIFQKHKDISIVTFGYRFFTNGKYSEEKTLPYEADEYIDKKEYLNHLYLHAGACVYRLNYDSKRIEYIKSIGYFDDNNIVINSLNYGDMYNVGRAIYAYRQTGISVYTSMNIVEQAVLNIQGLDVDIKLLSSEYYKNIVKRYSSTLITMYLWKRKLKKILGAEKFGRYLNSSKAIKDSIAYRIMIFDSLPLKEKQLIRKMVYLELGNNWRCAIKQSIKYLKN